MSTASTLNSTTLPLSDSTHDRVTWRLMPLLLVCYVFAHLDRINIGFAKLQMSADLHFSDTVYGLGAGLFFIAYALFGLPSNLMLERIGPRRWIACLMLVWGCLSTAMLLVETARGFYLLRFLLGVAEAGFFPGILVYLNRWFPARRRGQITALFAIAVPMAGVIGGPLSGWILEGFHDALGLRGWQWMFLIEGLPVVLLGVVVWCSLPESFERVTWLSDEQKHLLREELAGEEQRKTITSFSGIFSNPQVWLLVAIYFAVMLAVNTIAFWMPSLIHGAGIAQDSRIGMLSAVPYLAGCAFMIFIGRSSDRLRERRWHLGIPLLMAAAGLSLAALAPTSAWLVMGGLVIAGMGASAALPMFWQLPPAFLSSATLAAGIALISSFGSIAAFLAPYLIGWMRDTTQSASLALYLLAILIALGAFFPVYLALVAGVRGVDRKWVELGRLYRLSRFALVRRILLPAALPNLFTGLRGALSLSWMFLVAAELIAATQGLGYLLSDGRETSRPDLVIAAILVLAALGKLSDGLLRSLERRALRWRDSFDGEGGA